MNLGNIVIKEVGPRDGLQNEKEVISSHEKIQWINYLSETGLSYIEVTSFVPSKWISQLSDAKEVSQGIERKGNVTYAALVPNLKGLEVALESNMDEINLFMSASETHNQKNINKSIQDTYPVLKEVAAEALKAGKTVRGYVSTVFGCPYEGDVRLDAVIQACERLFEYGVQEISLGDTIGIAHPAQVEAVLTPILKKYDASRMALHFHDTRGMALANVLRSLDMGITTFDSSLGGLGGCPYAPGASGNVATDDLVYMIEKMGYHTGIDEEKLHKAAVYIQDLLRKPLPSHQVKINAAFNFIQ